MSPIDAPLSGVPNYFPRAILEGHGALLAETQHSDAASGHEGGQDDVGASKVGIGWVPDPETYRRRLRSSESARSAGGGLPAGWPERLRGPLTWSGQGMTDQGNVFHLSRQHKAEIDRALASVKGECYTVHHQPHTYLTLKTNN